jgi:hypothetical protein
MFVCLPCQDNRERQIHHLKDHEKSAKHIRALAEFDDSSSSHLPVNNPADALGALLASATANPSQHHPLIPPSPPDHSAAWPAPPSPVTGINWNLLEATENTMLEEPLQEYIQSVSQVSLDFINGNLSEDKLLERTSLGSDSSQGESFLSPVTHFSIKFYFRQGLSDNEVEPSAAKCPHNYATDPKTAREWFPWPDRIVRTLLI